MQTETNACLQPGLEVYYVSRGNHLYGATVNCVHEHDRCDLTIYGNVDGKASGPILKGFLIPYDSEGEQFDSWHKKSDVTLTERRLAEAMARIAI